MLISIFSPDRAVGQLFQAAGVVDQLVQIDDNLSKLRPIAAVLLPAAKHELVQHHRAVHRCWQPVALIYGLYHLKRSNRNICLKKCL